MNYPHIYNTRLILTMSISARIALKMILQNTNNNQFRIIDVRTIQERI